MRVIPYDVENNKDRKRSDRKLRKKKKSKWIESEVSKPTKACRTGNHDKCDFEGCPCYCHGKWYDG